MLSNPSSSVLKLRIWKQGFTAMIWTDVSGLLEEATKDAVQRPEFEERLRTKADVVKLGMKADQDLVDAVVERIEQRVETMYGDVEHTL